MNDEYMTKDEIEAVEQILLYCGNYKGTREYKIVYEMLDSAKELYKIIHDK